jgi:hypothetical protein
MASNSGMTALLLIGVGVGGYALYRWYAEQHGGGFGPVAHGGHPHPAHPAARGYFAGNGYEEAFTGRGGGGFHRYAPHNQPEQQPDMSQQGGGAGGEFGQSPMQQPPYHQPHGFGRHR